MSKVDPYDVPDDGFYDDDEEDLDDDDEDSIPN